MFPTTNTVFSPVFTSPISTSASNPINNEIPRQAPTFNAKGMSSDKNNDMLRMLQSDISIPSKNTTKLPWAIDKL